MRAHPIAASVLVLLAPLAAAQTMSTTDQIIWPETGTFAAYPAERLDGRIWRPFVYGALHWDDNIFRFSTGARSEMVRRLGAGIRAEIPISLQRVLLEASIEDNAFDDFDHLDYVGHRLSGIWRWQVGRQLSGDVGGTTRKVLGGYGDVASTARNLVTENRAFASAGYMVTPRWRVRGAFDASDVEHSDPARDALETQTTSTTVGLDYMTPGNSSVGGQVRFTRGESPTQLLAPALLVNNDYDQTETSLVGRWVITAKTALEGRVGYTRREHDQLSGRDYKGTTGRLRLDWGATPKTHLTASAWREVQPFQTVLSTVVVGTPSAGTLGAPQGEFAGPGASPGQVFTAESVASYVVAKGVSLGPVWAPTEKIVAQARVLHEKQDFQGDPGIALALNPRREDTYRAWGLSLGYTPIRALQVALGFESGKRTSNIAGRDYDFETVTLSGRFSF
jgi:exopolysaccharide biosynthesis operon protein EpsL